MNLDLATVVAYGDEFVGWLVEDEEGGVVVQSPDGKQYQYSHRWEALATPYELARMYTTGLLYQPRSPFDSLVGRITALFSFLVLNAGIGIALVLGAWRRW